MIQLRLNVLLLAAALLLVGGVAAYGVLQPRLGETAEYDVVAVGPEGILFEERVHAPEATALSALQVAATAQGLALTLEEYPGMGTYVRAIGEHRATGANGWIYEVLREGEWTSGDRSAERFALEKDDALRWSWTTG